MSEVDFLKRGKELLESGNIEEAVRYLDKAYANDPDNDKILNILGLAYFKSGRLENAYQIYRKLINKNPDNPTLRLNIGVLLFKKKEYSLALEELVMAEKLDPSNTKINYYKGVCYEQEKDYNSALAEYKKSKSEKNIEKMEEKLRTRKSKFKIKDDSREIKNITTEDILVKHFGKKGADLENIENEEDIDRVFSEKNSEEGEEEGEEEGFFDSTKLTEEFDSEGEITDIKEKPEKEKEEGKPDAEDIKAEKFEISEDEDVDFATDALLKELNTFEEDNDLDDSFDRKVEDFLKSHQKKEYDEFSSELQDTNSDIDSGIEQEKEQEAKHVPDEESDSAYSEIQEKEDIKELEEQVREYLVKESTDTGMAETKYHKKILSLTTLENMTVEFMISDQDGDDTVLALDNHIIRYSFEEAFFYKKGYALALSGSISKDIPEILAKSASLHKSLKDDFSWVSGQGRIFLQARRNIFVPVELAKDAFTVNMRYVAGADMYIISQVKSLQGLNLIKFDGRGYLFMEMDHDIISVPLEEGVTFICHKGAFLGYMGGGEPAMAESSLEIEIQGPGIAFLVKGI